LRGRLGTPASFREDPVGFHETLEHRRDQLAELVGLPGLLAKYASIGNEIAMNFRGDFSRDPDGLLVRDRTEL
jgi:hypothetical protein